MAHGEEFSNTLLVEVDGRAAARRRRAAAGQRLRRRQHATCPDLFVLRFSDDGGTVLAKARFKIGAEVELSLQSHGTRRPRRAPRRRGHGARGGGRRDGGVHTVVRGLDESHRLFRGTRVEAYVNMTASDIVTKVAQRAGLQTARSTRPARRSTARQPGRRERLGLPAPARGENDRLLSVVSERQARVRRAHARRTEAPGGHGGARSNPLVLERGVNLVHLRGDGHLGRAGPRGRGARLGPCAEAGGRRRRSPPSHASAVLDSGLTPARWPRRSAARRTSSGLGLRRQPETRTDGSGRSLADHLAGGFAELEGTARGNPQLRAGTAVEAGRRRPAVRRASTRSVRPGTTSRTSTGYTTSFSRQQHLRAVAVRRPRRSPESGRPRLGVVPAVVTSVKDPDNLGRVKVKLPWLSDDLRELVGAHRPARGRGQGRGLTRCCPRSTTRCWSPSARATSGAVRARRPVQRRGQAGRAAGPITSTPTTAR